MKDEVLTGLNGQLIIMSAHRYALGRRTYIVSSTVEWLKENWKYVNENSRFVILRDTAIALLRDEAGDECDFNCWKSFWNWGIIQNPEFWNQIMSYCQSVTPHPERLFDKRLIESD